MLRKLRPTETMRSPRGPRGLTLLEVAVSVAILVTLVAVLVPVVAKSKRQAKVGSDNEAMRHIGQAAALYTDQHGPHVRSCFELYEAGMVPKELLSGLSDPTELGWSNVVMLETKKHLGNSAKDKAIYPRDYRISYIGAREGGGSDRWLARAEPGSVGWLVNISSSDPEIPQQQYNTLRRVGHYYRLLRDGAVVKRQHIIENFDQGRSCVSSRWFYGDFSTQDRRQTCEDIMNGRPPKESEQ